jgi:hypothetical protein
MLLGKVGVRFLVMAEDRGLGIKHDIPLQVRANVPPLAERCRQPTQLDVRVGLLAALDTLDEIQLVQTILRLKVTRRKIYNQMTPGIGSALIANRVVRVEIAVSHSPHLPWDSRIKCLEDEWIDRR